MCDFENYTEAVVTYLPQISRVDGMSIYELGIDFAQQSKGSKLMKEATLKDSRISESKENALNE